MSPRIVLSGVGTDKLATTLRDALVDQQPRVMGLASAFVTVDGVRELLLIQKQAGGPKCRLVAGTDNAITHPEALYLARENGWGVRLGRPFKPRGIFHPKLLVAGARFSASEGVTGLCCVYVGSSNLTTGGLAANVECGFVSEEDDCVVSGGQAFAKLWSLSLLATENELRNYAARFAECARRRTASELRDLGVDDTRPVPARPKDLVSARLPPRPAVSSAFAVAAWAGLESFTGEYRLQVEFPRHAGEVISRLVRGRAQAGGRIRVFCPDDEMTRSMQYRFYADNSMFRLNVPNDAPGAAWARAHHAGIAVVEQGLPGGAPIRFRIVKPGPKVSEIVGRSAALGTWGRTSTRAYGWF